MRQSHKGGSGESFKHAKVTYVVDCRQSHLGFLQLAKDTAWVQKTSLKTKKGMMTA